MIEQFKKYLEDILLQHYNIQIQDIKLETPPKSDMGDIACGCFLLAKDLKKSPNIIASELKEIINQDTNTLTFIQKLEVDGPYLNIFFSSNSYANDFAAMMKNPSFYDTLKPVKKGTICIDYVGANVGKPLHIGHMCTPLNGQVFVNVFRKLGYEVISDSHIGDWGIIFGKLIVAFQKYGDTQLLKENAVEHLFQLYVKISEEVDKNPELENEFRSCFKKLSSGDPEMISLWESFTKSSISAMNIQLSRLFVHPDYDIGESFYEGLGLPKIQEYPDLKFSMHQIVEELIEKGIAIRNEDNSVGVVFPDEFKIPSCILQKRDGTHGYLASDLTAIRYRVENWNPDKILYFVDVRQQLHFNQAFTIAKLAGWIDFDFEIFHAFNGFITLKDGPMSTRKGKIIKLGNLLDEAELRARKIIEEKRDDIPEKELIEISKIVGIGAIKYGYLKKSRENDVIFDWDEFMSFEGNSGPYIQYSYVRAKKIRERYPQQVSYNNLSFETQEEKELVKHILGFTRAIEDMISQYQPSILCTFVYDMTKKFSTFYNNIPILSEENENIKTSRLAIVEGYMRILKECFEILGIPLPDKM